MSRTIVVPTRHKDAKHRHSRKRAHSPWKLTAAIDDKLQQPRPSLICHRRYPSQTLVVPPLLIPLYWFDRYMLDKKMMTSIPPDTFAIDGRRFKVLAQDEKTVGRFSYTRWLVFEEAAVPKGEKP